MVLISTSTGDIKREQSQRRLLSALESRKIAVETVSRIMLCMLRSYFFLIRAIYITIQIDGADPELKERRDYLFSLSQKRGQYPQCFMRQLEDGSVTFLGDWDTVEVSAMHVLCALYNK